MEHFYSYVNYLVEKSKQSSKKKFTRKTDRIERLETRVRNTKGEKKKFKIQERIKKIKRNRQTILNKLGEKKYNKKLLLKGLNDILISAFKERKYAKRAKPGDNDKIYIYVNAVKILKKLIESVEDDDKDEIIANYIADLVDLETDDLGRVIMKVGYDKAVETAYNNASNEFSDAEQQQIKDVAKTKRTKKNIRTAALQGKKIEDGDTPTTKIPYPVNIEVETGTEPKPDSETNVKTIKSIYNENKGRFESAFNSSTAPLLSTKLVKQKLLIVKFLQKMLKELGHFQMSEAIKTETDVDGYFGSDTKKAIVDFQTTQKLDKIDGIVGSETWRRLYELFKLNIDKNFKANLSLIKKFAGTGVVNSKTKTEVKPVVPKTEVKPVVPTVKPVKVGETFLVIGKITNQNDKALDQVKITVKGAQQNPEYSNIAGAYDIKVPIKYDTLVFSKKGCITKNIKVTSDNEELNVKLIQTRPFHQKVPKKRGYISPGDALSKEQEDALDKATGGYSKTTKQAAKLD